MLLTAGLLAGAAIVVGLFVTMVNIAASRDMAARRGTDPDEAARITLLGGDVGLAATYLKNPPQPGTDTEPLRRPVAERLGELEELRRQQLITDDEGARRRAEIISDI